MSNAFFEHFQLRKRPFISQMVSFDRKKSTKRSNISNQQHKKQRSKKVKNCSKGAESLEKRSENWAKSRLK